MRVKVLYFGVLRERFGVSDTVVEVPDGVSAGEFLSILRGQTSNDAMGNRAESDLNERLWRGLAVAVNREYTLPDLVLRDGDEVALLPPVSGGLLRGGRNASFARECAGHPLGFTSC